MSTPPLTVLIPTHGRPALLKRTLDSVVQCELPEFYKELVVIENGSRAGAEELVTPLPERLNPRYMHRKRGNKSYALNEALGTIEDGLVVFFDDDVRVEPQVLVAYAEAAEQHGAGYFFGGPVEIDYEKPLPPLLSSFYPQSVRGYKAAPDQDLDFFLGFNWAAFRTNIQSLGGFDPRFGPGSPVNATGQETEMQARMRRQGLEPINVQKAKVYHYFPSEYANLNWLLHRYIRGGTRAGLLSEALPSEFFAKIVFQTMQSIGVLGKGALKLDLHKIVFFILNTAERVGVVKGYLQQKIRF